MLGIGLYDAGKLDSAKAVFTADAVKHPSDYRIRSYLGLIAARQGDRETAERVVQSLDSMPGLPSGRALRQGRILAILGDTARAMRFFETAVPTSPETAFAIIHTVPDWSPIRSALMAAFNPNRGYERASDQ
jgi:tetratricopeptide (TPR) repeat protein